MTQVVGNLLNNASKYTPNGGPLARGEAPACPAPRECVEACEQAATVLIVDDNEDAAELLTIALENAGISARAAYNAQAAIAAVASAVPSVVVLDIGLPDMNGYELAQRLRADERLAQTLFIALTGWGTQEDRRKALAAGFDIHLTKPVSVRELREALARAPKASESLKGRVQWLDSLAR